MKAILRITILISFTGFYGTKAQTVVQKDTIAGTELTMSMDKDISSLLKDYEENCILANTRKNTRNDNEGYRANPSTVVSRTPATKIVASRPLTNNEICRQNPKILGYKIQLTVVKSNEEANEVKAYFRRRFPNIKAETDASLRPNYKILVGSYFNRQSASSDLAKIKQYFKSALPVQYRIFCVEAK